MNGASRLSSRSRAADENGVVGSVRQYVVDKAGRVERVE